MIIGILQIELFIPESGSLKTKRFAVKSIKERLKSRFNVSVAEIDNYDKWQRASLGVVTVSNESKHIESILGNVMNLVYGDRRVEVIDTKINYA
ncbi:MAG: DUF503 domain-containing protein [Candidatus Latescibacteria bacterium]|jgi:uncharacterized protein|nr:DUF503 domain-containing protein [Candidatus Latescibacterota bacterium]